MIVSIISGGLWIYFTTNQGYALIPRMHIFAVLFVMFWIYLNYLDPLFLPIGLAILLLYPVISDLQVDNVFYKKI